MLPCCVSELIGLDDLEEDGRDGESSNCVKVGYATTDERAVALTGWLRLEALFL